VGDRSDARQFIDARDDVRERERERERGGGRDIFLYLSRKKKSRINAREINHADYSTE